MQQMSLLNSFTHLSGKTLKGVRGEGGKISTALRREMKGVNFTQFTSNPNVQLWGFLPSDNGKTAGDTTFTFNLFIISELLMHKMFIKF